MPETQTAPLHERVPDAVLLCRFDDAEQQLVVVSVNDAGLRMFDTCRDDLVGHVPRRLLAGSNVFQDDRARRQIFSELRETGHLVLSRPVRFEARGAAREARVRLFWSDPGANDVLIVAEDVTGSLEQTRRERANERLAHAAELAGVVSHHLNNSLAIARFELESARELAEERAALDEEVAGILRSAAQAMDRSADIVRGLASVATAAPRPADRTDIDRVLRELTDGRAGFVLATPSVPMWVSGGDRAVRLVLEAVLDLVSAARAEGSGGRITLTPSVRDGSIHLSLDFESEVPPLLMRMIVDPSTGTVIADEAPVRFFAAMHVLHALGGSLGPRRGQARCVELRLPSPVASRDAGEASASVLLVTRDGALLALLDSPELPYAIVHADDGRAAARLLLRRQFDVVLYDSETLELSARELGAIDLVRDNASARVVFITRDRESQPDPRARSLRVPFGPRDAQRAVEAVIEELGRS